MNENIDGGCKNKIGKHLTMFADFGELSGIRTPDTLLKRQVLCLLS